MFYDKIKKTREMQHADSYRQVRESIFLFCLSSCYMEGDVDQLFLQGKRESRLQLFGFEFDSKYLK